MGAKWGALLPALPTRLRGSCDRAITCSQVILTRVALEVNIHLDTPITQVRSGYFTAYGYGALGSGGLFNDIKQVLWIRVLVSKRGVYKVPSAGKMSRDYVKHDSVTFMAVVEADDVVITLQASTQMFCDVIGV